MDLFMRDVYPEMGTVEVSTSVQPDEADLITEHDDQKAAEHAGNGTIAGGTKRNLILAFVLLVVMAIIMGIVE